MQRTEHPSTAVRAYKRTGDKLKPLTSDVPNTTVSAATKEANATIPTVKKEDDGASKRKENCINIEKENGAAGMINRCTSFAGVSNFTVNIN